MEGFGGISVVGYDPGGDGKHGIAYLRVTRGRVEGVPVAVTVGTAEAAIQWVQTHGVLGAVGIDTLTAWCTGPQGLRPADRHLRKAYPAVRASVLSPNSLYGAMVANGICLARALRERLADVVISETHPKVLYYALAGERYDYAQRHMRMDQWLGGLLGTPIATDDEHQWDALISAWAAAQGLLGTWPVDLHALPPCQGERMVMPTGLTRYYWPPAGFRSCVALDADAGGAADIGM